MTIKLREFLIAARVVRDMPEDMSNLDKIKRLDVLDKAAVDALPEIEELVEWVLEVIRERGGGALVNHFGSCQAPSEPCTCGLDRIREITK